jgi:glutathione S-transferase
LLTLHHAPNSRSSRIIWLLKELEIPFELNAMAFHPKDLKSEEHRARHPLGRIPVLDDDDVRIYESGAIVEYVLARHAPGKLKPAVDSPEFPNYLQWFNYTEGMIMPPINTIIVHTLILPPERRDEAVLNQAQRLVSKALAPINEALVGKDYLAGEFSAADIMLGHACIMSGRLGLISEDMSDLTAYVERLKARPACAEAFAA